MSYNFTNAVNLAEKAVYEDSNSNHEEALSLYIQSLELLFSELQSHNLSDESKCLISNKLDHFLTRAETLKAQLAGSRSQESHPEIIYNRDTRLQGGRKVSPPGSEIPQIITEVPLLRLDHIVGQEAAKESLKELVVLPLKFPHLFIGHRRRNTHILLFGPPGSGKKSLARALATETQSTLLTLSMSNLNSPWRADGERLVKDLFTRARNNLPSIILLENIDGLCTDEGESEAPRRIKTELLVQIGSLYQDEKGRAITVVALTTAPWNLKNTVTKRFAKRIYIPGSIPSGDDAKYEEWKSQYIDW
ncbi:vacuolar protein sorting-associated protein 4B [Flagelloscypha sp. PMI_526]|nr:vacuolar protein sorting-associated protein 4B [Flagelloscypha sp. PMI_526]